MPTTRWRSARPGLRIVRFVTSRLLWHRHLAGARGNDDLLPASSYDRLHAPQPGTTYGGGWAVVANGWAGTPTIWHNGSNGRWFAQTVIAKDRNAAVFVATNSNSRSAIEDMINVMIRRFEAR